MTIFFDIMVAWRSETNTKVSPTIATQALKSHKFNVIQVISSKWNEVKKTKDFNFVQGLAPQYTYLGFKVGKWENNK